MINIVIGLGYGDEGKGRVVDALSDKNTIVVRFNGGPQAGHTVFKHNKPHIFSSLGSGTLKGARTYWSKYCTFNPEFFMKELETLHRNFGIYHGINISPHCPVTTPWDYEFNRLTAALTSKTNTCGHGFGNTLQREEDHYRLKVFDLQYRNIADHKIANIGNYYTHKATELNISTTSVAKYIEIVKKNMPAFLKACERVTNGLLNITDESEFFFMNSGSNFVFEGAQGVLLDQEYGFFPNVTRSKTTAKNAIQLISDYITDKQEINIHYVNRIYHTRHGDGFFDTALKGVSNPFETNIKNPYQGTFKHAPLNIDMLSYAYLCANNDDFSNNGVRLVAPKTKLLILTCIDNVDQESIVFTYKNELKVGVLSEIIEILDNEIGLDILMSNSPHSEIPLFGMGVHKEDTEITP